MNNFTGDILPTCVPFVFFVAGMLAGVYQRIVNSKYNAIDTTEIDPDIRVRVTGKIS